MTERGKYQLLPRLGDGFCGALVAPQNPALRFLPGFADCGGAAERWSLLAPEFF